MLFSKVSHQNRADRPITAEERAKLHSAINREGCVGGKLEFDDGHFEVDDAKCEMGGSTI